MLNHAEREHQIVQTAADVAPPTIVIARQGCEVVKKS